MEYNETRISQAIKNILQQEFQQNNRQGLFAITQKSMAYHSNRIE